VIIVLSFII